MLWLGASEHHLPFGGTLTATLPTYEQMLVELLTPLLRDGFRRVMLLNGHGGNIDPLHVALRRLDAAFPRAILTGAAYWELAEAELAALCDGPAQDDGPRLRDRDLDDPAPPPRPRPQATGSSTTPIRPPPASKGLFWARDFGRRTDHGAVGHPELADAERGKKMLDAVVRKVTGVVEQTLSLPLGEA